MNHTESPNELSVVSKSASGCGCGGPDAGGCACGHDEAHPRGKTHEQTRAHGSNESALITTEFAVTGMTCGHCVSSVSEELDALDGVESVEVDLNAGGASRVTLTSQNALEVEAVRAAVNEAGYSLEDA